MPIHDKKIKAELWRAMGERFSPFPVQCQFCGSQDNLTLDHIIDSTNGGPDTENNIQVLCALCHAMKNLIKQMRLRELVLNTRGKENNTSKAEEYLRLRKTI